MNWPIADAATSRRRVISGACSSLALSLVPRTALAAEDLDSFIRERMAIAQIPGLALGIACRGRLKLARGYGFADLATHRPVTTDTMFHIASITKTITASAVMLALRAAGIGVDDLIKPHLDFAIAGDDAGAITFRHLLMHTSGISDEVYYQHDFRSRGADSPVMLSDFVRSYLAPGGRYTGSSNVHCVPGSHWAYSNVGFALLGYLASRLVGRDMRGFASEQLFQPLGLRHMVWTIAATPEHFRATPYDFAGEKPTPVQPVGFPDWPAGMIRASITDLTTLMAASANHGTANGRHLLGAAETNTMLAMRRPDGLPDWLTGQGLAWQSAMLAGVPRVNHWGGDPGVFTMAYLDPEHRVAVVLLSNLSATPQSRDALKVIAARALDAAMDYAKS